MAEKDKHHDVCYASVERQRGERLRGSGKLDTGSREEGLGVASPWEQLVQSCLCE